jgi:hypothetical protein
MTDAPYGGLPPTHAAKDQAGQVAQTAKDSGQRVAGTAAEQGKNVMAEGKAQARHLGREVSQQVTEQTTLQKDKATTGLRSLGDELNSMASQGTQSGMATDLAQQAASKAHHLASWLEARDPGTLLEEVRGLARRKPGTFLLGALAAGVVAGRLTRGAVDASRSDQETPETSAQPVRSVQPVGTPGAPDNTTLVADLADVPTGLPAGAIDTRPGGYDDVPVGGYR